MAVDVFPLLSSCLSPFMKKLPNKHSHKHKTVSWKLRDGLTFGALLNLCWINCTVTPPPGILCMKLYKKMHGEWEKRCLCACNVGLMSWTVCHPPTAVSERSVLSFRKTAASPHNLLSLYFAQQDAAAFPSPPATNPTRNPDGAHTQTPPRSPQRHDKDVTEY